MKSLAERAYEAFEQAGGLDVAAMSLAVELVLNTSSAEIERLREDNETLNEIIAIHGNEINRLRAALERAHDVWETEAAGMRDEIERLRADAERYRWLRDDAMGTDTTVPIVCIVDRRGRPVTDDENYPHLLDGDELDAAIDAAMKEEK